MQNILYKLRLYWRKHRDKPLFKGKILAVILVTLAIIINYAYKDSLPDKGSDSAASASSETDTSTAGEINIGETNIAALCVCIAALAAIKIKREKDLQGNRNKNTEKYEEDE
ncbi:MAG: hypothetical protein NC120_05200 [Ruminococcus sp.]|nr:hypothetical protein [Ruminococcus sp.]